MKKNILIALFALLAVALNGNAQNNTYPNFYTIERFFLLISGLGISATSAVFYKF